MKEFYYIAKSKLNFKLLEKVMDDEPIQLNEYNYIRLNSKPRGRTIKHNLIGQDSNDRFIIYN